MQDVQIDVTEIVHFWNTHADTNFGFVLLGDDENLKADTETICKNKSRD